MFKKILIASILAVISFGASALQDVAIASANRASGTVNSADMYARDQSGRGAIDQGIIVNSYVTVVTGAVTMTFKIQGKTPQGEYYDVPGAALTGVAPVVATVNTLIMHPGITAAAGATIAQPLPPVFRVVATTTSTGSATYSIGVSRTN